MMKTKKERKEKLFWMGWSMLLGWAMLVGMGYELPVPTWFAIVIGVVTFLCG